MSADRAAVAMRVLEEEFRLAGIAFREAKKARKVGGDFLGSSWQCGTRDLLFRRMHSKEGLDPSADKLARCFIVDAWTRGGQGGESLLSKLTSFRHLADVVREEQIEWHEITSKHLNKVSSLFAKQKKSTRYHRVTALTRVVEYLNRLRHRIDGTETNFLPRKLSWSHGVQNPTRQNADVTSEEHIERRSKLYKPEVEIALAKARAKVVSDPKLEPCPGYDRIRIESTVFSLGMGIRVGEITTLHVASIQPSENGDGFDVRVAIEKGALPELKRIPKLWEPAFVQAHSYLLETCAAARRRAKEIEERGFKFVCKALEDHRRMNPLDESRKAQFRALALDSANFYSPEEVTSCFDVSTKEFSVGGRYYACVVNLPKLVSARLVVWLDERVKRWDWSDYAVPRFGHDMRLTLHDVSAAAGVPRSCATKAVWFAQDLREFLADIKAHGYLDSGKRPSRDALEKIEKRWHAVRKTMLSHSGGAMCTVIDMKKFTTELADRYTEMLNRHFQECIEGEDDDGSGFVVSDRGDGRPTRLSEHLIVVWEYHFSGRRCMGILPRPLFRSDLYNYLSSNAQKKTVFQRLSLLKDDGNPYSLSMHDIRRWLNTALRRAGVSELALDIWMGRKPRQGRQYDYRTGAERAAHLASRLYLQPGKEPNDFLGRKVRFWRSEGVSEAEIAEQVRAKLRVFHFTPWGGCSKDLYVSPCEKGLQCLRSYGNEKRTCQFFHVDPTDMVAKRAIERMLEDYKMQLGVLDSALVEASAALRAELNDEATIDQHIAYMLDMISGCEAALEEYEGKPERFT